MRKNSRAFLLVVISGDEIKLSRNVADIALEQATAKRMK